MATSHNVEKMKERYRTGTNGIVDMVLLSFSWTGSRSWWEEREIERENESRRRRGEAWDVINSKQKARNMQNFYKDGEIARNDELD